MTNYYILDTNELLKQPQIIKEFNCVIPSHVLREIEHLERTRKSDRQLQYEIRNAKRYLRDNKTHTYIDVKDYKFTLDDSLDAQYVDNILLQMAIDNGYGMISNDTLLLEKCKMYNIETIELDIKTYENNLGFKEFSISETEHRILLENEEINTFNLIPNEYAIINNVVDGELLDVVKWDGKTDSLKSLVNPNGILGEEVKGTRFPTIRPKDEQQAMAIDSIRSNQITSLRGRAGSGKSLIALYTLWNLVETEGYKLVVFVNPTDTKDSQGLGYYKGDKLTKLLQSSAGSTLLTKFGDEFSIIELIDEGLLEIQPFSNLRGYDCGENKIAVWILEAQNLTSELLKLGLQRLGENTKAVVDGDFHQQIDTAVYDSDNGMKRMSEVFRGDWDYGEIELQNVYRSRIADIADKM